ncbi:MAG TPA: hypothetical protein EYQ27_06955 [Gemmatimonadetes bacterium]|nr:hypothetical protein [Gemmatimonadota bacterium]
MRRRGDVPPLYNPAFEHDGCGTGFVASIDGAVTHRVVELAVRALVGLTHRGAVSADAASGDGAGLTIQIPRALLAADAARWGLRSNELDRLAVAMVFLPNDALARPQARKILERAAQDSGVHVLGWRTVPIDPSVVGGVAKEFLPGIEQLLLARPEDLSGVAFERMLYLARRRAEAAYREHDVDAYVRPHGGVQGPHGGSSAAQLLSRPRRPAHTVRAGTFPPALRHQHTPELESGTAVPHDRAQRRNQHTRRESQLDVRARARAHVLRLGRGPERSDPGDRTDRL